MSAQSGVSVMSSLFLATPSLIRLAAVNGTKCASVVQLQIKRIAKRGEGVAHYYQFATSEPCSGAANWRLSQHRLSFTEQQLAVQSARKSRSYKGFNSSKRCICPISNTILS